MSQVDGDTSAIDSTVSNSHGPWIWEVIRSQQAYLARVVAPETDWPPSVLILKTKMGWHHDGGSSIVFLSHKFFEYGRPQACPAISMD